jgi:ribonuclease HI
MLYNVAGRLVFILHGQGIEYFKAIHCVQISGRSECEEQVNQFPGAVFKKFGNVEEAEAFVKDTQSITPKKSPSGKKRALSNVVDEKPRIVVYSDGACKGNGKAGATAGIGVYFGPNDPRSVNYRFALTLLYSSENRNLAERCPGDQTNNRAELIASLLLFLNAPIDLVTNDS